MATPHELLLLALELGTASLELSQQIDTLGTQTTMTPEARATLKKHQKLFSDSIDRFIQRVREASNA